MSNAEKMAKDIGRKTRRKFLAQEKILWRLEASYLIVITLANTNVNF